MGICGRCSKISAFNYLLKSAGLGMALAFLWHFSNIWRYGSLLVQEPNRAILFAEIGLMVLLAILFFVGLVIELRKVRK